ncbi:MAG: hypothetical protein KKC19_00285 [Nanoarchaeota archaeon]|nr:hypothetical protein [Nanoarchaeota archaeon]
MTKIVSEQRAYLYGRTMDRLGGEEEGSLTIYVNPKIFDDVRLSSLEGFFVIQKGDLNDFTSQFVIRRDWMAQIQSRYGGKFVPFPD